MYAPALSHRATLTLRERASIVTQLTRYTGADSVALDRRTLTVDRRKWLDRLAPALGPLGTFDTRRPASEIEDPRRVALIGAYLRDSLGFVTDLTYQGLEQGWSASGSPLDVNSSWKWDQGDPNAPLVSTGDGPPGGTPPWVQRVFALDRSTKWFVAAGTYDSLNSCALIAYQAAQLEARLRDRVSLGCYDGGHMIYEDAGPREQLARDLTRFYR